MIQATAHAPADRHDQQQVLRQAGFVPDQLKAAFDALPYIALVLNRSRQVVYGNAVLLRAMGMKTLADALGARPGEIIGCVHAGDMAAGCGTSESCRHCGAVNVVLQAQRSLTRASGEARITTVADHGRAVALDLRVTCSPFTFENEQFFLLFFEDISAEKRKQQLERIFFHDIINTCGGLLNAAKHFNCLKEEALRERFCECIYRQSHLLMEEILAQRDLLAAENNTLAALFEEVDVIALLNDAIEATQLLPVAEDQPIVLVGGEQRLLLETDARLLRRVILNLLKNAVEAPNCGGKIRVGAAAEGHEVLLWVANPAVMPEEVRQQIFQRSFSTKGKGRGVGTYSMKLLLETYLHGRVSFTSSPEEGTVFAVRLPQMAAGEAVRP